MNDQNSGGIVVQKKHILIAVIMIIVLLIGGIVIGASWSRWFGVRQPDTISSDTADSARPPIELDENAGDYTGAKPADHGGEEVGIKIPGYPSITVARDTQDVTMALLNPEGNPCYFRFEITLKENDELLFSSKYVKPGDCIYDVHLSKPLAAGEYPATIKITTVALDGETPLNGANVETVLIAK